MIGSKHGTLGLQNEGFGSGPRVGVVGFKVGSGKKGRERSDGFRELNPKNYTVVVLDENNNPNS